VSSRRPACSSSSSSSSRSSPSKRQSLPRDPLCLFQPTYSKKPETPSRHAFMADNYTYPRLAALTQSFRLGATPPPPPFLPFFHSVLRPTPTGAPKNIVCSADGRRIAFVRSPPPLSSSFSAVNSLWVADVCPDTGAVTERLVFDPTALPPANSELSAAELARRERMRESTAGVTAFSTDARVQVAVFSVRRWPTPPCPALFTLYVFNAIHDGGSRSAECSTSPPSHPKHRLPFLCPRPPPASTRRCRQTASAPAPQPP
jgi:hypothetical protein